MFNIECTTAQKVSVFGVILVRIFPILDSIRRDTLYLSVSVSEYGRFLRSDLVEMSHFDDQKDTMTQIIP